MPRREKSKQNFWEKRKEGLKKKTKEIKPQVENMSMLTMYTQLVASKTRYNSKSSTLNNISKTNFSKRSMRKNLR